ncbi:MAG: pantetheine-phosphate adenylyltransferase [Bacteriovoracaceae bacterium]|jgi:pantetheine-phosphate adenylyltransferase|nr:pantetheine-phosphate adenylyltransferase [Bacteriovoracaceae bacterium]
MDYPSWKKQYFSQVEVDEKILEQAYRKMSAQAIAVYAISADPPTWGHADIMMRAAKKFKKVYWIIAKNSKKKSLFSEDDKLEMMQIYLEHYKLDNVKLEVIEGSTARFAKDVGASFLIRGLRSSSDYQLEFELSVGNRGISKNIETICMFTKPHYATISSNIVRELALLGEKVSQYVHPRIEQLIANKAEKNL